MARSRAIAPGLILFPDYLDDRARDRLVDELRAVLRTAPPYTPRMPRSDRPFSVQMTNAGPLGWVSDRSGYRYQATHPETERPWPAIPATALEAWSALCAYPAPPEACLINLYAASARMGLHQDRDEEDFSAPVLSLSLGAPAVFRYGGLRRSDPTRSIRLEPGDGLVIGGPSRLIFHGIDRVLAAEPDLLSLARPPAADDALGVLLASGGRCNLTLRRITHPQARLGA